MNRPKKNQIVLNLTGGLGNQLFQVAAALSVANKKEIFVDKSIGEPRGKNPCTSDIEDFRLPSEVVFGPCGSAKLWQKRFIYLALRLGTSSSRNVNFFGANLINRVSSIVISLHLRSYRRITTSQGIGYANLILPKRPYLVGYFQSYRWASEIYETLREIRLHNESSQLLEYINYADKERPLMVHVRLGDYTSIATFGIPSADYYSQGIEAIISKDPNSRVWLFSNEPSVALDLIPKVNRENVRVISPDLFSPAETLELMRHCHNYVIANSTFSWWGAYLSYNPNAKVIAPRPWFKGEDSPKDILPPEWKPVNAFEGEL
jgi:hypothetical protein